MMRPALHHIGRVVATLFVIAAIVWLLGARGHTISRDLIILGGYQ